MLKWNTHFAQRTRQMRRSSIREILKLTQQPDVISFAGGLPAPELFPVEQIRAAVERILTEQGARALQYSTTEGLPELREFIATRMSNENLTVKPENVVIVGGAQQALDLLARVLMNDGDKVIVENPTYLGELTALRPYRPTYLAAATDEDGLCVDEIEPLLAQRPAFMYLVPNFQNPQGVTLSLERRLKLVGLLAVYGIPVIEDNPYGHLIYSGEMLPSILELDAMNLHTQSVNGHVIYVGTFSKILAPGLRLGWVIAPEVVIDQVVLAKQSADLHTSTFTQMLAYETIKGDFLDGHIARLRDVYRERRDVMLAAMARDFPAGVRWTQPNGGLFLLVTLPQHIKAGDLLQQAIKHKVAFVPGDDFHVNDTGQNTFRLNFSNANPELIEIGIQRLGALLCKALQSEIVPVDLTRNRLLVRDS